jgi:3-dehydroquinate dehydratase type I
MGSRIVAVIATPLDLRQALRLRDRPDLFELRLDALHEITTQVHAAVAKLRAPFIITARDPREGGLHHLPLRRRRDLLLEFLPLAAFVDVELRSVKRLESVLKRAAELRVLRIISVHDLRGTPSRMRMQRLASEALAAGADIFKLVTRVHDDRELERLLKFFAERNSRMPMCVMPVGGDDAREARLRLAEQASALTYTHLGTAQAEGQWALHEFRRALQRRS